MTLTPETSSWISLSHPSHVAPPPEGIRPIMASEVPQDEPLPGEALRAEAAVLHPQRVVFPLWCASLLVAVGVKCVLLPFPVRSVGEFVRWLLRLAIVTAPDAAFLAGMAGAALLAGMLAGGRQPAHRWWRRGCAAAFGLYALYAAASLPMYRVMVVPFSVRMISFIGGPVLMWSSLRPFLSAGTVLAIVVLPLLVVAAPRFWQAWRRTSPSSAAMLPAWCMAGLLLLVCAYAAVCEAYVGRNWTDRNRWERRIAHSAHWVLLRSCVEEAASDRPLAGRFSFTEFDESDFVRPRAAPKPLEVKPPRNVILIVLESCGVGYLNLYGAPYQTMPRLAERARERGVVFDNVYAQATSSCKSLVCLSASVYPRPDWLLICRDSPGFSVPTISEVLRGAGYRTCYAHAGYWAWKGRDRFLRSRVDKLIDGTAHPHRQVNSWGVDDAAMYEDILNWIDEAPDRPFFVFAYTIETHHPYVAPRRQYDFGVNDPDFHRYLNAVREADRKIARFLEELRLRGLDRDTLVAITADHGESFGEHGQRMHSFCQYEQDVHVPLVLLYEGFAGQARREACVGQHIDVAPTLLHLLGIPAPAEWQGQSLFDADRLQRAYFVSMGNEVVLGVRDGRYKYSFYVDDRREELFDLSRDPQESRNLAADQPERCRALRARVAGLVQYQRAYLTRHGVR